MIRTGRLSISEGEARVGDVLLGDCDNDSVLSGAVSFLENRGFTSGQSVSVTGTDSHFGGAAVFCMTKVEGVAAAAALTRHAIPASPPRKRRAAKKKR